MAAIHKTCVDCHEQFDFSPSEQQFYRKNNLVDPKRCYPCRKAMRRTQQDPDQPPKECFGCHQFVRGVATDANHQCLDCGRVIPEGGVQYAVVKERGATAA